MQESNRPEKTLKEVKAAARHNDYALTLFDLAARVAWTIWLLAARSLRLATTSEEGRRVEEEGREINQTDGGSAEDWRMGDGWREE